MTHLQKSLFEAGMIHLPWSTSSIARLLAAGKIFLRNMPRSRELGLWPTPNASRCS